MSDKAQCNLVCSGTSFTMQWLSLKIFQMYRLSSWLEDGSNFQGSKIILDSESFLFRKSERKAPQVQFFIYFFLARGLPMVSLQLF